MQGIRNFWQSGLIGKIVLSVAGVFAVVLVCCVGLLLVPPRARNAASSATAVGATVPTDVAQPTTAPDSTAAPTVEAPSAPPEPAIVPTAAATPTPEPTPIPPAAPTDLPSPLPVPAPTAAPAGYVSRAMLVTDWPLTVEDGTIACIQNAVIFRTAGETYAVNGTAQGRREGEGWKDIDDIWADDVDIPGAKKNIGPLIDRGLALCQ